MCISDSVLGGPLMKDVLAEIASRVLVAPIGISDDKAIVSDRVLRSSRMMEIEVDSKSDSTEVIIGGFDVVA